MLTTCMSTGDDSTYGYYDDPDDFIVEGSYVEAKNSTIENNVANCASMDSLADDAETYLTNEGYSDLVSTYSPHRNMLIHAANALLDIKRQFDENWARASYNYSNGNINSARTSTFVGCLLQAFNNTVLAGLGANWATASRTTIIKAVGKIAVRYLSWVGAAIAVITFVDCMWG